MYVRKIVMPKKASNNSSFSVETCPNIQHAIETCFKHVSNISDMSELKSLSKDN